MVRPSRRTKLRPLTDAEYSEGTVDGDEIDWPTGVTTDTDARDTWKQPVVAATTANITIATALNAGDTIDGVTLALNDRVLVMAQTLPAENGIYIVGPTPTRAGDLDEAADVLGAVVYVIGGTTHEGTTWRVDSAAAISIGIDDMDWTAFGGGGLSIAELDDIPDVNAPTPADGDVLTWDSTPGEWVALAPTGSGSGDASGYLLGGFDGGGDAAIAGSIYYGVVPFTGTIDGWVIQASTSSDAEFDVAVAAAGTRPTFPGDSIVAADPPTMTADDDAVSATLTGWTTALTAGQRFAIKYVSGTALWAQLIVTYTRP